MNELGAKESRKMARVLRELGGKPTLVFSSPLPRALKTAKIAAKEFGVPLREEPVLRPGCGTDQLRSLLKKRKEKEVIVVGHQPDFSAMLKSLTGAQTKLAKSGIARVDLDEEFSGKLIWLLPAKLAKLL